MPTNDECLALYERFAATHKRLDELLPAAPTPLGPTAAPGQVLSDADIDEAGRLIATQRDQWVAYIECVRDIR